MMSHPTRVDTRQRDATPLVRTALYSLLNFMSDLLTATKLISACFRIGVFIPVHRDSQTENAQSTSPMSGLAWAGRYVAFTS